MSEVPQSFKNHAKIIPIYHYFALPVAAVARVTADRGTTYVFLEAPVERRLDLMLGRSLLHRLVEALPGVDIRLCADRSKRAGQEP